jgi:uncharacterized protein YbbC (DUF1343 family)
VNVVRGGPTPLRSPAAAVVLALISLGSSHAQAQPPAEVRLGMEVLFGHDLARLRGRNVGVVCNHTAVDRAGTHLVDRLLAHPEIAVRAIFTPEHGYRGDVPDGGDRAAGIDPVSGARIYGLYESGFRPPAETMKGLDVVLYDIQDVGARFYTYISTLGYAMQAAAQAGVEFWVLDRPNPISGSLVEGPVALREWRSFVGLYPIPIRYGMTAGELARMIVGEGWLEFPEGFAPRVIELKGWKRALWVDETDAPWRAPSPNMLTPATATVYPGTCLLEGTNISEGRGTNHPFEWVGAPWIDSAALLAELRSRDLPGVVFEPVTFVPELIPGRTAAVKYLGESCRGVAIRVVDRRRFAPVATAVHLLHAVRKLHGESFRWRVPGVDLLYGGDDLRVRLEGGAGAQAVIASWSDPLESFLALRRSYLLYR